MRLAAWAASLALFMAAGPACAQVATGGVGAHRSSILWFDWGTAPANIPNAGTSVTNTLTMAGQSLSVTCTLNAISGSGTDPDLRIYRPGTYFEDSLDNLYNVGGTGTANAMDIGVMNRASGSDAALTYACSATLGGQPYALEGLVFADAQSTNINESTQVTVPAGATVRAFERHRAAGCNVP